MYHGQFEKLTELATGPARQEEVLRAKAHYFARTGEVFEDDRCFEARMASFLEFYLFDWVLAETGITPAQLFADETVAAAQGVEREAMLAFLRTHHSLFEVEHLTAEGVHVRDLFTGKTHQVHERRTLAGLAKGDLLEARLVPLGQRLLFSQAFCYHPLGGKPSVVREIARQQRQPDPGYSPRTLIFQAAKMALKLERYRNIKVEDIYRFDRLPS